MADIINFPPPNEQDWRGIREQLRKGYATLPDGLGTIDECLPAIHGHWKSIFVSYDIELPSSEVPAPLTDEQVIAIRTAIDAVAQQIVKQLKRERHAHLGLLIEAEYKAAYQRRNGSE